METNKKILLTTIYNNSKHAVSDYWKANTPNRKVFNFSLPRIVSFGLRFLKQNVPEIEIIEFPSWKQYIDKLKEKKWDVVGFSFFLNETHEIIEMAKYARKVGVSELWAGNYGALTPDVKQYFDKIFYGYSENQVAQQFGYSIDDSAVVHPPICGYVATPYGIKVNAFGYLFTSRGCPHSCSFCQTPAFCKKPTKINVDHIKTVIDYYKKLGLSQVMILDENFGTYRSHSDQIIDYLHRQKMYWFAQIRADTLTKRFTDWKDKHMAGSLTSIESLNQTTLDAIHKREKINDIIDLIKKMIAHNKMVNGSYMIGFENETVDSIKNDIKKIAKLKMDITQICVVTPLPLTPLWDEIDKKYGIFDKDWHHYTAKHLIWNHPQIAPEEMKKIVLWSKNMLYPRLRPVQTTLRFINKYLTTDKTSAGIKYTVRQFFHNNTFEFTPHPMRFIDHRNLNGLYQPHPLASSQHLIEN